MKRRSFIQQLGLVLAATSLPILQSASRPSHLVTLSFDDGFKKSFLEAARIHEQFGLPGCFNVIASAQNIVPTTLKNLFLKTNEINRPSAGNS